MYHATPRMPRSPTPVVLAAALVGACATPTPADVSDLAVTGCPTAAPASGDPCSVAAAVCEYGSDRQPDCDTVARCNAGAWRVTAPAGSGCPSPTVGVGAECPGSLAQVSVGMTCARSGIACGYPQGLCACSASGGATPKWQCEDPQCPQPRPRLGSACDPEGRQCVYGLCPSSRYVLYCNGGRWSWNGVPSLCL
jgi:hypothetical protein